VVARGAGSPGSSAGYESYPAGKARKGGEIRRASSMRARPRQGAEWADDHTTHPLAAAAAVAAAALPWLPLPHGCLVMGSRQRLAASSAPSSAISSSRCSGLLVYFNPRSQLSSEEEEGGVGARGLVFFGGRTEHRGCHEPRATSTTDHGSATSTSPTPPPEASPLAPATPPPPPRWAVGQPRRPVSPGTAVAAVADRAALVFWLTER
jgi:hypothetical protein